MSDSAGMQAIIRQKDFELEQRGSLLYKTKVTTTASALTRMRLVGWSLFAFQGLHLQAIVASDGSKHDKTKQTPSLYHCHICTFEAEMLC